MGADGAWSRAAESSGQRLAVVTAAAEAAPSTETEDPRTRTRLLASARSSVAAPRCPGLYRTRRGPDPRSAGRLCFLSRCRPVAGVLFGLCRQDPELCLAQGGGVQQLTGDVCHGRCRRGRRGALQLPNPWAPTLSAFCLVTVRTPAILL